jgi:hypothetical protein
MSRASVSEALELLVAPFDEGEQWEDVLRRAGVADEVGPRPRRRLVLAAAAVAAVALAATAYGVGRIGGFSAWLSGVPGVPADPAEQEAFEQANRRSWSAFPGGPELRTLIEQRVDDHRYELYGFRTGGSLCLRLVARGLNGSPAVSCAPLAELRGAEAPALVVLADHALGLKDASAIPAGQEYVAPTASATFGIVADGVIAVELVGDAGTRRARVEANAFLAVAAAPKVGERVREVFALTSDGRRVQVPFVSAPFGTWDTPAQSHREPRGPSQVERRVVGGRVAWIERREQRGEAPDPAAPYMRGPSGGGLEFARLLAPDPESHLRLLVGVGTLKRYGVPPGEQAVCYFLVAGGSAGGGCNPLNMLFPLGPFIFSQSLLGGGHQFETISGLASDEVARLEIFFATGERRPIPLRHNAFVVQTARAKYPIRVVAYDRDGRVIGIETRGGDAATDSGPRPAGEWRTALTVRDESGGVATLRIAPSSAGGKCYEYRLPGGAGGAGCHTGTPEKRPKLGLGVSGGGIPGTTWWVTGDVVAGVAEIELRFPDGTSRRVVPTERFVLVPVPLAATGEILVLGFDTRGEEIARQRLTVEPSRRAAPGRGG